MSKDEKNTQNKGKQTGPEVKGPSQSSNDKQKEADKKREADKKKEGSEVKRPKF